MIALLAAIVPRSRPTREYALVSQRARRIEVYRREGDVWVLREATSGQSVELASVGCRVPVDAVYREPGAAG